MTEAVKLVTFLNVVFILILALSSSFGGFVGECVYYLAFAIPVVVGFYSSSALKTKREEIKGVAEAQERFFAFGKEKAIELLPLIAPVVLTVFLASLLTSIVRVSAVYVWILRQSAPASAAAFTRSSAFSSEPSWLPLISAMTYVLFSFRYCRSFMLFFLCSFFVVRSRLWLSAAETGT